MTDQPEQPDTRRFYTDERGYIYSSDVEVGMYRFRVAYDAGTYDPVVTQGWVVQLSPRNQVAEERGGPSFLVPIDLDNARDTWDQAVSSRDYFKEEVAKMRSEFMQQIGVSDAGDRESS